MAHTPTPTQTLSPQDSQLAIALAAMAPVHFKPPALLDPNYVPPSRGRQIIAVSVVTCLVASIVVGIRLALRFFSKRQKAHWDDYLIIPATLASIAHCALAIAMVKVAGFGMHAYDINLQQVVNFSTLFFIEIQIYWFMEFVVKLSVLVFVRRLYTPAISPHSNRAFMALLVFCTALFVGGLIMGFTQCDPPAANWNLRILVTHKNSKCPGREQSGIAVTVLSVLSNLLLLSLAIHKVWHLRVLNGTRVGIVFLLSLGALACVFAAWRCVYIGLGFNTTDVTWYQTNVQILTTLELNTAIICASLPATTPLLKKLIPRSMRSNSSAPMPHNNLSGDQNIAKCDTTDGTERVRTESC